MYRQTRDILTQSANLRYRKMMSTTGRSTFSLNQQYDLQEIAFVFGWLLANEPLCDEALLDPAVLLLLFFVCLFLFNRSLLDNWEEMFEFSTAAELSIKWPFSQWGFPHCLLYALSALCFWLLPISRGSNSQIYITVMYFSNFLTIDKQTSSIKLQMPQGVK